MSIMKIISILFLLIQSVVLFSQEHIKPIVFDNYTPKWQHLFVDSSRLSDSMYLGTTHLWYIGLNPIVVDSTAYFLLGDKSEDYQGAYIEKININSGDVIWSNVYGLSNSDKQEFPSFYYINDNDNLEILNFRNIMKKEEYFPFNWTKAQLSKREYSCKNGMIVSHSYNKHILLQSEILKIFYGSNKIFPVCSTEYLYIYPYKKNNFKYALKFFNKNIILTKMDTIIRTCISQGYSRQSIYLLNKNTIITGRHMHNQTLLDSMKQENFDSSKYLLDFYTSSFESINTVDITRNFPYNWVIEIQQPENNFIKILCKDSINIPFVRPYLAYLYFDKQGNLIETIDFKNKYVSGKIKINKLPNQQGAIIVNDKSYKKNKKIEISKTDGNGNIEIIKTLMFEDERNFYIDAIKILDNNTLLIWYDIIKVNASKIIINSINGVLAIDNLGLVNNQNKINYKQSSIKLYPNPVKSYLSLEFEDRLSGKIEIFNLTGQLVKKEIIIDSYIHKVELNNLKEGVYLIKIVNKKNEIIYKKKFVKI